MAQVQATNPIATKREAEELRAEANALNARAEALEQTYQAAQAEESNDSESSEPAEKPLSKQNKGELQATALAEGVDYEDSDTVAELKDKIQDQRDQDDYEDDESTSNNNSQENN